MPIELTKDEIEALLPSIQRYLREELDVEAGVLKARLLLDYVLEEIAPYAYNRGVADAEAYFRQKTDELPDICFRDGGTYWTKKDR